MKRIMRCIKKIFTAVLYCFKMSWKASKYYTIVRMLQQLIEPLLGIGLSCLGKYIIDFFVESKVTYSGQIIAAVIFASIINVIIRLEAKIIGYSYEIHYEMLQKEAQMSIMKKYLQADLQAFDDPEFRDCMEVLQQDIESMINILWNTMRMISGLISLVVSLYIVSEIGAAYILLIFIMCMPSILLNKYYVKQLYDIFNKTAKEERLSNYFYNLACEKVYALQTRLYGLNKIILDKFSFFWTKKFFIKKNEMKKLTIISAALEAIPYICIGFIMLIVVKDIIEGNKSIGDYTLYSTLLIQFLSQTNIAFEAVLEIYSDYLHIFNVRRIQKTDEKVVKDGQIEINEINEIVFDNVSFSYPGTQIKVLESLSFKIGPNEKVALIGTNGSGKSTIIKLVLRFYNIDSGTILINNIPIEKILIKSLRASFSVYFQGEPNFVMSIKENVTLSSRHKKNYTNNDLLKLLEDCGGNDIIEKINNDLETVYSKEYYDDGVEFSGGQKQKLSVARTFFKDASVYVLDEPSSALDPEAEYKLLCAMKKYSSGKITIFVSHRMSNMRLADKILLIEDGRKIAFGSHKELLMNSERYKQLYEFQTKEI